MTILVCQARPKGLQRAPPKHCQPVGVSPVGCEQKQMSPGLASQPGVAGLTESLIGPRFRSSTLTLPSEVSTRLFLLADEYPEVPM